MAHPHVDVLGIEPRENNLCTGKGRIEAHILVDELFESPPGSSQGLIVLFSTRYTLLRDLPTEGNYGLDKKQNP